MGFSGHKLLLKLNATHLSSGKLKFYVEKVDNKVSHLYPFSCIPLVGSQLTVLTSYHPRSLSKSLLEFVENPVIRYESTKFVSGFQLEIYQGSGYNFYNRFNPQFSMTPSSLADDRLQADIECSLLDYVITVFENVDSSEQSNLRIFLLITVSYYQQELIPFIKGIKWHDMEQRARLASKVMELSSTLYRSWESSKSISPGNALFIEKLKQAKDFHSYLI